MAAIDSPTLDADSDELLAQDGRGDASTLEETPACQTCRKKKSKCSREHPCSQCVKSGTDCVYEDKRAKGGIKTGVIERLSQRIDTIENMFLGQNILLQQLLQPGQANAAGLSTTPNCFTTYVDQLKQSIHVAASGRERSNADTTLSNEVSALSNKRKRSDGGVAPARGARPAINGPIDISDSISPLVPVESVLETYFRLLHPWIPVIHRATFLRRVRQSDRSPGVTLIIQAIVAVTSQYTKEASTIASTELEEHASQLRHEVIATAIESNSKEALQALIVITYDSIKRGLRQSPWPLVSIICRKIEDLQLNLEEPQEKNQLSTFFSRPVTPLPTPNAWLEVEERRRVFWATFLLDRFSSIVTGANPIISSKNVQRRLPCDGYRWELDQCVETSFFKIQDQSQNANEEEGEAQDVLFPPAYSDSEVNDDIGGLAYTIEATESLFLVSKFHDRHALELENSGQLSSWLRKFRQLDSRLLQWELCLTHRWREVRVVNGYIDPNLTLAHMTHNAAIISLHRRLAHPPSNARAWLSSLVSAASREACVMASIKVDGIARRYLDASNGIPPHQFALCLHIAGSALLVQVGQHSGRLLDTVDSIITSLHKISDRLLNGQDLQLEDDSENPARKFAKALQAQRDADQEGDGTPAETRRIRGPEPELPKEGPLQNMLDYTAMYQTFESSDFRGRSTLGMTFLDQDSPNDLDQALLSMGQFQLPNSKPPEYRASTQADAQPSQAEPESDFLTELRRLESKARQQDRRLRSHANQNGSL